MNWFKNLFKIKKRNKTFVLSEKCCPICQSHLVGWKGSRWEFDKHGQRPSHGVSLHAICPNCQKLTVDDPWVPDNENEPMQATPYEIDWVKCPNCGWRFSLGDTSSWSEGRHCKCGQRLEIICDRRE